MGRDDDGLYTLKGVILDVSGAQIPKVFTDIHKCFSIRNEVRLRVPRVPMEL